MAAAMNSVYSFWWDVTNDWGLELLNPSAAAEKLRARRQSPRRLLLSPTRQDSGSSDESNSSLYRPRSYPFGLRSLLLYPLLVYPLLIFLNLVLRLTWSIKLSSHLHSDPDGSLAIFWLEIAELVRRWLWVFLRVEWEVVGNLRRKVLNGDSEGYELFSSVDDGLPETLEGDLSG
jgi:hypothetical protein